jgi:hypothetical protein
MRLIFQIATVVLGWAVAARTYEIKWDNNGKFFVVFDKRLEFN